MFIICKVVGLIPVGNLLSIILQVGAGVIVYILILLVLKDKFTYDMIKQIKDKCLKIKLKFN